jgi:hypothetical protein
MLRLMLTRRRYVMPLAAMIRGFWDDALYCELKLLFNLRA